MQPSLPAAEAYRMQIPRKRVRWNGRQRGASYEFLVRASTHSPYLTATPLPAVPPSRPLFSPYPSRPPTMVTNTHAQAKKDLRSEKLTSQYSQLWKSDSAQDTDADRDARLEQYTDVVNGESTW